MKRLNKNTFTVILFSIALMVGHIQMKGHNQLNNNTELNKKEMIMNSVLHLTIKGMHCLAGCANGIDAMLKEQEGIIKSETSFDKSSSVIEYDSNLIPEETILKLIKERGFEVEVVTQQGEAQEQK